ncbi:hypothetical protein MSIBF_A1360013 [groundwater metagenome]|uniref:Transglutaminase-like domain-containing protein n=1 Tax=groundwater metagenome TaxID=717931 RepID=A0A098E630_9ZZZZ
MIQKILHWEWHAISGNHNITVSADTNNNIFESNETNNNRAEYFSISSPSLLSDLIIIDIIIPSGNVNDGNQIQFNVSIKNNGTGNVNCPFFVSLYANGNLLINNINVNGINANEVKNVTIIWWNAMAGTNNITAMADDTNCVTESNETNNDKTIPFSINVPYPDLIITNLTFTPTENISSGTTVTFKATVKNIGQGKIQNQYIYVGFQGDNTYLGYGYLYITLVPGESVNVTYNWNAQAGNYSNFTAKADCLYSNCHTYITESNETNNDKTIPFSINVPYPDLIITNLTFAPTENISSGTQITFTATVKNIGQGKIQNQDIYVGFWGDNTYLGYGYSYITLVPGESVNVTYNWNAQAGNYSNFTAKADYLYCSNCYTYITESNETNNDKTIPFLCLQPNIAITKTASNYSLPVGGGNITYYYNITNTGNVPLYNVNVSDDKCSPVICPNTTLASGQSMKCNCSTQITQTTTNIANATAYSPQQQIVSATANTTVIVTPCDISITNLTFNPKKPVNGYMLNLNISINSTFITTANVSLTIDGNLTESKSINLSEGINYDIFTILAKLGLHNVSVYVVPLNCDINISNNDYNTTYNASTPILLIKRYLNNLTKQTANISLNGTQTGIMDSPKDNMTLTGVNYSKSSNGLGVKDIGTGKVVMTYKGTININVSSSGGELSIYTPSAASSDRQSRNVTVRLKDNTNITTGDCTALSQCTFMYDSHNTETIKLDFNNLASGTHALEYEVNITTDINNFNYTIQSLSKGSNSQYLQNDSLTQWTQEIQSMAQNLTQNCSSDFEKVGKISRWVYENITYDINLAGQPNNASWVFTNKKGVCAHYTNLLISMCRSIGIPARGVYGDVYNSSDYLGGHAWAEVFMDGKWYTVDPTFNEIGFIDSGHVSEGYDLSTLESSFFSAEGYGLSFNNYDIFYPDLKVLNTANVTLISDIINITPKWRVTNVLGNTVTYEIIGIFNNSREQGYIIGNAYLWPVGSSTLLSDYTHQVYVGQNESNTSWRFNITLPDLNSGSNYTLPITISTDPTPLTSLNFNAYTAATYEIYNAQVPTTIQSGTTATLNVTIRNIGANSGTANVEFYVDDNLNTTNNNLNVPGISGINTIQFNLNTAPLSQGNHTIKFVVKKDNEQQDVFTKTINVGQLLCSNNVNCLGNQFCNSSQQCQNLNCSGTTPYVFNHTCVNCTDNSTCGVGFCNLSHACQPISCSNNNTCRSEQFCNNTICQNLNCLPNQTASNHTCINCVSFDLDTGWTYIFLTHVTF